MLARFRVYVYLSCVAAKPIPAIMLQNMKRSGVIAYISSQSIMVFGIGSSNIRLLNHGPVTGTRIDVINPTTNEATARDPKKLDLMNRHCMLVPINAKNRKSYIYLSPKFSSNFWIWVINEVSKIPENNIAKNMSNTNEPAIHTDVQMT